MSTFRCFECNSINHTARCHYRQDKRESRAQSIKLCAYRRVNGISCANKALKGNMLCHVHANKHISPKLEKTCLFHICFLYCMRHYREQYYDRGTGKRRTPLPWGIIQREWFPMLTVLQVRAHYVRLKRFDQSDKVSNATSLKDLQALSSAMLAGYLTILNMATIDLFVEARVIFQLNGVQYRFGSHMVKREDACPVPVNTYTELQCFDGFLYDVEKKAFVPKVSTITPLQVMCMQMCLKVKP